MNISNGLYPDLDLDPNWFKRLSADNKSRRYRGMRYVSHYLSKGNKDR